MNEDEFSKAQRICSELEKLKLESQQLVSLSYDLLKIITGDEWKDDEYNLWVGKGLLDDIHIGILYTRNELQCAMHRLLKLKQHTVRK